MKRVHVLSSPVPISGQNSSFRKEVDIRVWNEVWAKIRRPIEEQLSNHLINVHNQIRNDSE